MDEKRVCAGISSWFEPKPDVNSSFREDGLSLLRTWKLVVDGADHYVRVEPLDFYHDEAANARLLEAMSFPLVKRVRTGRQRKPLAAWECWPDPTACGSYDHVRHVDRKTAILMAFLKWAGITLADYE